MLNKQISNGVKEIIRWLSFLILFLPILVLRETLFPYVFPKIVFFQIAVEIIFALWLILVIGPSSIRLGRNYGAGNPSSRTLRVHYGAGKDYRPDFKNPLLLSLTVFMGILILTSLLGMDVSRSFFSTQERMTGIITFIHFYLWFLVLGSLFKDVADWRRFVWLSLTASLLVGLYGIGQKLGWEFLLKGDVSRLSATLGNPIYLSVYAMLHVFLAGFLILQERKKILKVLLIILILFNLVIMSLGASRGVILSFGFSLFLFLISLIILFPSKKIKVFVSLILIFIISGFIFLQTPKSQPFLEKSPLFLKRIATITPTTFLITDWSRILAWQAALEGFKEKPILGWGWENYNLVFNKFYNPRYLEVGLAETWFDKSHNQVLDILCLTGIFGLLSYLAFFFFIFRALFKKSKEYRFALGPLTLGLMMFSYFLQNLFVFDTPAPLISFYFSLGLIYFYTKSNPNDPNFHPNVPNNSNDGHRIPRAIRRREARRFAESGHPILGWRLILFPIILIFLFISIYQLNILPFSKSRDGARGAVISPINFESGFYFYKNSLKSSSFTNPEVRLMLAKTVLEEMPAFAKASAGEGKLDEKNKKELLDFAISEMEKNTKEHPFDVKYYLALGKLERLNLNFEKAAASFEKALELSPKRQEVFYELGQVKISQGEFSEAAEIFEKALKLNEKIRDSHWYYGLAQILNKNYEQGIKEIETAHQMGRGFGVDPALLLIIAHGYAETENFEKAIYFCDLVLKREPKNTGALAVKAFSLIQLEQETEALKVLEILAPLDEGLANQLKALIR